MKLKRGEELIKFADEEYDQIIKEMYNRLIDLAYLKGEKTIREIFPKKFLEKFMKKGDEVEINYGVVLLVNDLYQVLGRIRRKKLKTEGKGVLPKLKRSARKINTSYIN